MMIMRRMVQNPNLYAMAGRTSFRRRYRRVTIGTRPTQGRGNGGWWWLDDSSVVLVIVVVLVVVVVESTLLLTVVGHDDATQ